MLMDSKRRVGVLRGGAWERHDESLKEGADLLAHLFENLYPKWSPQDIFVDREGIWHLKGRVVTPADLYHQVDLVWNTSDPSISQILKTFGIPYIGIDSFSQALTLSRQMLQSHIKNTKICLPAHALIPAYQEDFDGSMENYAIKKAHDVFRKFPPPYLVRPYPGDRNMSTHSARNFDELATAIYDGAFHGQSLIVEELVPGKECTVHAVRNFRGQEVYQLMPKPVMGDNESLRLGMDEKEKVKQAVGDLHFHFENPHYIKFNFVLHPKGEVYLKDFGFAPDFSEDSHLSDASKDLGFNPNHVLEHILLDALK